MLKGNCPEKSLTTCERKISSYKPALKNCLEIIEFNNIFAELIVNDKIKRNFVDT